jgi:sigma-B regulation protein RsbU (phosphoserine phosphatase)
MFWLFLFGALIGGLLMLVPLARAHRETDRAEEQNQKLGQDLQRQIEFMRFMAAALSEGVSRQELQQRIVRASVVCTGALSACFFEQTDHATMRGVAVEGLFPPQWPLGSGRQPEELTRAKFIEHVLKSEEFPMSEGVIGRVAQTRRGELIADATIDPHLAKHADPALVVRSLMVVPLELGERLFGVLAVANPEGDRRFDESDLRLMRAFAEQAACALQMQRV